MPVPFTLEVVVVLSRMPPALVDVVVVEEVCANALNATALAAPAANNFINLVCFMFVFVLVKRMLSVVFLSDLSKAEFIQRRKAFRKIDNRRTYLVGSMIGTKR